MPSMIPQVNFSSLRLIQVEIHLSCWMNLRMKALIHNCIWEGLFFNYLVINMVTMERTCRKRRLGIGFNPAAKKDSIPKCSAKSYILRFQGNPLRSFEDLNRNSVCTVNKGVTLIFSKDLGVSTTLLIVGYKVPRWGRS